MTNKIDVSVLWKSPLKKGKGNSWPFEHICVTYIWQRAYMHNIKMILTTEKFRNPIFKAK